MKLGTRLGICEGRELGDRPVSSPPLTSPDGVPSSSGTSDGESEGDPIVKPSGGTVRKPSFSSFDDPVEGLNVGELFGMWLVESLGTSPPSSPRDSSLVSLPEPIPTVGSATEGIIGDEESPFACCDGASVGISSRKSWESEPSEGVTGSSVTPLTGDTVSASVPSDGDKVEPITAGS